MQVIAQQRQQQQLRRRLFRQESEKKTAVVLYATWMHFGPSVRTDDLFNKMSTNDVCCSLVWCQDFCILFRAGRCEWLGAHVHCCRPADCRSIVRTLALRGVTNASAGVMQSTCIQTPQECHSVHTIHPANMSVDQSGVCPVRSNACHECEKNKRCQARRCEKLNKATITFLFPFRPVLTPLDIIFGNTIIQCHPPCCLRFLFFFREKNQNFDRDTNSSD